MKVTKEINFNGVMYPVFGTVISEKIENGVEYYIVDFSHDDISYRGMWRKSECRVCN